MVSSARPLIACFLFILTVSVCAQSQTVPDKSANSTISGRVAIKGKGVSGIVVGLVVIENHENQSTRNTATTDEDGNYRITNIPPGSYAVAVSAPAYISTRRPMIIGKGDTVENVDFSLIRGGVITGKVTDSDNRPLIEVPVHLTPLEMATDVPVYSGSNTDDRGIYRSFGLKPGKYKVFAGQDGNVYFGENVSGANYSLTYHADGSSPAEAKVIEVTEGGEVTDVDIVVGRQPTKYSASGRIVDGETGQPVAGVRYGAHRYASEGYGGTRAINSVTNKEGEFHLRNLAPGTYAVMAEVPVDGDWRIEPLRFEVVDQDVTGLLVKTKKGASITGVLVLDGMESKPIPNLRDVGIQAYVSLSGGRGSSHHSMINPDGSFRVGGLPPGNVSLWFGGPDHLQIVRIERDGIVQHRGIEIRDVEQVSGIRVIVDYATGTIRGVVKPATGSLPAEGKITVIWKRLSDSPNPWVGSGSAQVDSRGQFIAQNLLPGTYEVKVITQTGEQLPPERMQGAQQVVVTSGNVTTVTLTLPQP